MKQNVVVSLSGGMDSSTLLLRCLLEYENVIAVSFDYGQKHLIELQKAQELISYLSSYNSRIEKKLTYKLIKIEGLSELLNSSLIKGGKEVPEGYYAESNQKETVVPNRNKIFSSIIQAIALSTGNGDCDIALGIHAGDFSVYPDCRQEFRDADDYAFRIGNWDSNKVKYFTPYIEVTKADILKDGLKLCKEFGFNFNEIYKRTNTSYKPYPSGNSDYKSASSVERILAFNELGIKDPIIYEDETGIVNWDIVKRHALNVEKLFKNKQNANK